MRKEKNLIVSEMVRTFQKGKETLKETIHRVAEDPKLVTRIYNQVYNDFSSEKSLKTYILNRL